MSVLAPGRNIVLVGIMAVGKSTVGRLLADRLQRPFVDTDELVARRAGSSIAELFARFGERRFRALEAEQIRHAAALRGQVLAVGGGALLDPGNVTQLRGTGDLVMLDADPTELAARVAAEDEGVSRPLLAGARDPEEVLAELRLRRDATYVAAASHVIDTTGRTPEEVAERVLEWALEVPGLLTRDEVLSA
jgi:shikimate kinase